MIISIIATVYNLEKYLPRTVESILNSTYQDFELILVDDGSTDGSAQLCDQLAGQDNRIRVIHKANAGVSAARNTGLENARGRYVMFVDGDDLIHSQMLEVLVAAIESGEYDFSMVQYNRVKEDSAMNSITANHDLSHYLNKGRVIDQSQYLSCLFGSGNIKFAYQVIWNKLFKRDFINDLKFIKTGSEDTEWNTRMALKMSQAIIVDEEMYYYIHRQLSMTKSGISPRVIDCINSYYICLNTIPVERHDYRSWCLDALYKVILHTRYNAKSTDLSQEASNVADNICKKTIKEFRNSEIAWPKKYLYLLFYHVPLSYSAFMWICEISTRWYERWKEMRE